MDCKDTCGAECSATVDSPTIYEIDNNGNLCGCGASCNSFCGMSCDGTSSAAKINYVSSIEVPDVVKVKYGDSEIYDSSKNKFV